jgi:hypothetical protein
MQLSLIKSFNRYGLSLGFSDSYNELGAKGAQLESMGYLQVDHALKWNNFDSFNQTYK